jgi:hypothetical protein
VGVHADEPDSLEQWPQVALRAREMLDDQFRAMVPAALDDGDDDDDWLVVKVAQGAFDIGPGCVYSFVALNVDSAGKPTEGLIARVRKAVVYHGGILDQAHWQAVQAASNAASEEVRALLRNRPSSRVVYYRG